MARIAALIYGALAYLLFLLTFVYMAGVMGDTHGFPKTVDVGGGGAFSLDALLIDLLLLALFAIQHSIMARPAFKRLWKHLVPVVIERSTYVVLASLCLDVLFWQWRPITGLVWNIENPAGRIAILGLCGLGALIAFVSSFLVGHTELFGLRQVALYARGLPYTPVPFRVRSLYRAVRHPIYLGTLLTFWAFPHMTTGHLLFALVMTVYVLLAVPLEERELMHQIGERYRRYRDETPMLIPFLRRRPTPVAGQASSAPADLAGTPDPRALRG
jgi:protein-S-isoprenylcysteine O-methyltransferase Ste14